MRQKTLDALVRGPPKVVDNFEVKVEEDVCGRLSRDCFIILTSTK